MIEDDKPELRTESAPPPPEWRRFARMAVVYVVIPYITLCVVLAVFQRSLIYQPTRTTGAITPDMADVDAGPIRTVEVTTDDGLVLHGWLTSWERERKESERWLVIYFSGNGGNRVRRAGACAELAAGRMDVLLVDYRGYGDNPGKPSEEKIIADAHAVWRFATEQRGYRPERTLVYGESLGGGVATRLASDLCRAGTPPAGLVVSSTFTSMVDAAWGHYPFVPVPLLLLDRYESEKWIADVTCPILAVHGEADRVVPIELGRKLFAAAPERSATGIEKRFVPFPDRNHNDLTKSEFAKHVKELIEATEIAESPGKS